MTALILMTTMMLGTVSTDPDEAVARGRESLDRYWSSYPWYDAKTDGVRPIGIPRPRSNYSFSLPDWLGSLLKWFIWILLVVLLAFLVYLLVQTYLRGRGIRGSTQTATDQGEAEQRRRIEALPFPVRAAQLDFLAEARRYYQEGQYGEAIKYLFSHELVQLDKCRAVRLTRGKTNRQYLRELSRGRLAVLSRPLEQTMLVFEDFFFGGHPVDRVRFETCWSLLSEFESHCKGETA
ncbi:MAG: DUF4129 domain-containing protein [Pirellulaceae bacterium]|nr:DUF4129 domain-containing protein [Pirellulaceae bacterium]